MTTDMTESASSRDEGHQLIATSHLSRLTRVAPSAGRVRPEY